MASIHASFAFAYGILLFTVHSFEWSMKVFGLQQTTAAYPLWISCLTCIITVLFDVSENNNGSIVNHMVISLGIDAEDSSARTE